MAARAGGRDEGAQEHMHARGAGARLATAEARSGRKPCPCQRMRAGAHASRRRGAERAASNLGSNAWTGLGQARDAFRRSPRHPSQCTCLSAVRRQMRPLSPAASWVGSGASVVAPTARPRKSKGWRWNDAGKTAGPRALRAHLCFPCMRPPRRGVLAPEPYRPVPRCSVCHPACRQAPPPSSQTRLQVCGGQRYNQKQVQLRRHPHAGRVSSAPATAATGLAAGGMLKAWSKCRVDMRADMRSATVLCARPESSR